MWQVLEQARAQPKGSGARKRSPNESSDDNPKHHALSLNFVQTKDWFTMR